jgi:hypothetical protein
MMRLVFKRLVLIGLNVLGSALGLRHGGHERTEVCLRTTDGGEIFTWIPTN